MNIEKSYIPIEDIYIETFAMTGEQMEI